MGGIGLIGTYAETAARAKVPYIARCTFVSRYQQFESISLQQTVRLSRDFSLAVSKSRQLARVRGARPGGTAGRDAQGSSTSRQLPVVSLSGAIPVPQCRLAVRDRGCTGAPSEVGLAM